MFTFPKKKSKRKHKTCLSCRAHLLVEVPVALSRSTSESAADVVCLQTRQLRSSLVPFPSPHKYSSPSVYFLLFFLITLSLYHGDPYSVYLSNPFITHPGVLPSHKPTPTYTKPSPSPSFTTRIPPTHQTTPQCPNAGPHPTQP